MEASEKGEAMGCSGYGSLFLLGVVYWLLGGCKNGVEGLLADGLIAMFLPAFVAYTIWDSHNWW